MNIYKPLLQMLFFLLLVFTTACSSISSQTELTKAIRPIITYTPSSSPSPFSTNSKWWITQHPPSPTLSFELQYELFGSLKTNGNCELPCFLGIVPGETSWIEARTILEPFVVNKPLTPSRSYSTETTKVYFTQIMTTKDIIMTLSVHLYVENDVIERIAFFTDGPQINGYPAVYDQLLIKYSLREIFLKHGPPDIVYLSPPYTYNLLSAYSIFVLYKEEKIMFYLGGAATEKEEGNYTVCPNIGEGDIVTMMFVFANPSDSVDIREYGLMVPFEEDEETFPVEEVTDMSITDFYYLIIDSQPACFDINYIGYPWFFQLVLNQHLTNPFKGTYFQNTRQTNPPVLEEHPGMNESYFYQ